VHVRWPGGPEQVEVHVRPFWADASGIEITTVEASRAKASKKRISILPGKLVCDFSGAG
jgi:uncharacterized protein YcfL